MRLFLAIYPSQEVIDYCRDLYRLFEKEKRNLKPIPLEQLHVTVRFIGAKVSDNSKNAIVSELKRISSGLPQTKIALKEPQFGFERQYNPRVLFAKITETPQLLNLQDQINKVIRKLDFEDTITWKNHLDKNFHLSIARFKPAATRSSGKVIKDILGQNNLPLPPAFVADQVAVIQSIINHKEKVTYQLLDRIDLGRKL